MNRRIFRDRSRSAPGFTVLEVVVALGIFTLISAAVMTTLLSSLGTTRDDKNRVRAANLAAREIDITRSAFNSSAIGAKHIQAGNVTSPSPLPGGVAGSALVVDGVPYTVVRTAEWTQQGAASGSCDIAAPAGNAPLAYLRVTVKVTWPDMGGVAPVMSSTLLTPPLGTFTQGTGHLRATVTDETGARVPGLQVVVAGPGGTRTQSTSDGGCAFFPGLAVGAYTVTVSAAGGIEHGTWLPTATKSATVVANGIAQANIAYATASTLTAGLAATVSGYLPAKAIPLSLHHTSFAPAKSKAVPGVGDIRTMPVWPFADGIDVWAGTCNDADPIVTGGEREDPVVLGAGSPAAATVPLVPVTVTVRKVLGLLPVAGATVVAVHAKDATTGCATSVTDPVEGGTGAGQVLEFPVVTNSSGVARAALPYGLWKFKVKTKLPQLAWPSATFAASAAGTVPPSITVTTTL